MDISDTMIRFFGIGWLCSTDTLIWLGFLFMDLVRWIQYDWNHTFWHIRSFRLTCLTWYDVIDLVNSLYMSHFTISLVYYYLIHLTMVGEILLDDTLKILFTSILLIHSASMCKYMFRGTLNIAGYFIRLIRLHPIGCLVVWGYLNNIYLRTRLYLGS